MFLNKFLLLLLLLGLIECIYNTDSWNNFRPEIMTSRCIQEKFSFGAVNLWFVVSHPVLHQLSLCIPQYYDQSQVPWPWMHHLDGCHQQTYIYTKTWQQSTQNCVSTRVSRRGASTDPCRTPILRSSLLYINEWTPAPRPTSFRMWCSRDSPFSTGHRVLTKSCCIQNGLSTWKLSKPKLRSVCYQTQE